MTSDPRPLPILSLSVLLALGPAAPQSQWPLPPMGHFAARLTEHGPIRRSLEAALASPIAKSGADRLGVSLDAARSELGLSPRHTTAAQVTTQGPSGSTNYGKTLLFVGILLAVALVVVALSVKD
jgi:hypothetical protein